MPRRRIAIVTDSTSSLPPALLRRHRISVVPLHVCISGFEGLEGIDVNSVDIAAALTARRYTISTSRPTPEAFAAEYDRLLAEGVAGVVSIHLSSKLSGTYESAVLAARGMGGRVVVIDAGSTGMGLGFAVLEAAQVAAMGAPLEVVSEHAKQTAARTTTLFYVDNLEYLRRGGRIGAASALVGTALAVKPILHVDKGAVVIRERVRTASRALARLVDLTVAAAGDAKVVDIAVQYLVAEERAVQIAERVRALLGDRLGDLHLTEIGGVIAVHVGPGMIGVVVSPRL